jgi:transcriptional regulator with XRE-family HTH domain
MDLPTGNMLRAARALAGLTAGNLAALAEINATTVSRMEAAGHRPVGGQARTVAKVIRALRLHGVEITEDGVRLAKKRR